MTMFYQYAFFKEVNRFINMHSLKNDQLNHLSIKSSGQAFYLKFPNRKHFASCDKNACAHSCELPHPQCLD